MAETAATLSAPVDQECVEGYLYVAAPASVLLLRRPPSRGGLWVPVSGKVEPTDPNLLSALRRELREETGFVPAGPPRALDWEVRFQGPNGGRWRLRAFAVELDAPYSPQLSEEHDAFRWTGLAEARRELHYPDNRDAVGRLQERLALGRARPPPPTISPAPALREP